VKEKEEYLPYILAKLEDDVILLWNTGQVVEVINNDLEYITLILLAVYHERDYWQSIGLTIGEASN